jgi:hypothetical protein
MADDLEHRLERVEVQHADYIRVLSSHTATMASMQQVLMQVVAELAAVRQRMDSLEGRFDRLDAFLRSKLNGGERR